MGNLRIFTIPNLLTVLRLIFLWPALKYLKSGDEYVALFFILLAGATDSLDGYVARKYNQISDFGKALDPVVDKIFTLSIIVFLVFSPDYSLPGWFLIFLMLREMLLVTAGFYLITAKKTVIQAQKPGKYSAFINGVLVILYILHFIYVDYLLIAAVAATLYSTAVYAKVFFRKVSEK